MAYKPSVGDIASRVGKAAEAWSPMIEHGIKADILAKSQAAKTAMWAKEKQLEAIKLGFETSDAQLKEFNTGIANDTFSIAEEGAMRNAYFEAFNRTYDNLEEYYRLSGVPITQKKVTHLTPLFSNLFEDWKKKNPQGDSAVLKWGVEDGVWGDVIKRIHPSIKRDDAQRVWESLWNEKFKDWKGREVSEEDLIKRSSMAGKVAEYGGGILDWTWELFGEKAGEFLKSTWRTENLMTPWSPGRGSRRYLEDVFGVRPTAEGGASGQWADPYGEWTGDNRPTITPTGEYTPMGMFGGGNGLIDGWLPNLSSEPDEELAADVANLGESVDTLENIEERAQKREKREFDLDRDISREAAAFLTKLLEAIAAYGDDEAEAILSREFMELPSSAKNEIQNYLMSQ